MGKELYISDGDIEALKQFYQVTSRRALIAAMLHHIDKLQIESRDRLQLAVASVRQVRQ